MKKNMFDNLSAIVADTRTDDIKQIDVAELHESEDNFFVVENIEQFAYTILGQGGVKDNLIVRPLETGGYEIISGHRRKAAVDFLIEKGENISRFLPCLVQNYASEEDKMIDLILMNVSSRQLSDAEMFQCYEQLNNILSTQKKKGEYFGRIRDDIASKLGVSPAQVGKMQNIDKNATKKVKEAVAKGEVSINTADKIAKLDKQEQSKIKDLNKVQAKDVEKKSNKKADVPEPVATNSNEEKADIAETSSPIKEEKVENLKAYETAIKGYLLFAAEEASLSQEQTNALIGALTKALKKHDKAAAEKKYKGR